MHSHARPVLAMATALTAAASVFGSAQSAPIAMSGRQVAGAEFKMIEPVHNVWGDRAYCWTDNGWNGAGWYRCGYAARAGKGWGGPQGWHGWYWQGPDGPQHWGHHYMMNGYRGHHGMHNGMHGW